MLREVTKHDFKQLPNIPTSWCVWDDSGLSRSNRIVIFCLSLLALVNFRNKTFFWTILQSEVDLNAIEVEFFGNGHSKKDLEGMVIWVLVDLVEYDICEALTDVNLEAGHL